MAKCRKEICSKNIQIGAKVTGHLMFNMLGPASSGFYATLYIKFGIQSGARGMSAYFRVVWDSEDICLFPLQEDLQNFYTLKILKLTYLFTPWSRVLLEKLTGFAASQEIPRIYATPKFITVLTSARQLSLS
jgi:hypothetical protein